MSSRIKVAIADDHGLMRQGIALMLQHVPDMEVVGVVSSGEEAVNLTHQIVPDVFLLDIVMRGMTGIEAARWITDLNPNIRIILISSEANKEFISTGIKAGIAGYVLKDIDRDTLILAIRKVMNGERFFSPEVMAIVFHDFYASEKGGKEIVSSPKISALTRREEEVIKLIAKGKSLKEIAEQLFITIKTVETHKLNIQSKLNLSNTAQLVRYAIENKLVSIEKSE